MTIGFSSFRYAQVALAAGALAIAAPVVVHAAPVVSYTVSPQGLPAQSGPVSTIDLTGKVGVSSFVVNPGSNQVSVTTANGGQIVQGSSNGQYAAPVSGGSASSPTYVTSPYFSTETGQITLTFAQSQAYVGLLWGSVGSGDQLDLYNGSSLVGTVTASMIQNAPNASFNGSFGAQGYGGSEYVLINVTGGTFNSVKLSNSVINSFEAANLQYAATNQSVPEPASFVILGFGLAGLAGLRRFNIV